MLYPSRTVKSYSRVQTQRMECASHSANVRHYMLLSSRGARDRKKAINALLESSRRSTSRKHTMLLCSFSPPPSPLSAFKSSISTLPSSVFVHRATLYLSHFIPFFLLSCKYFSALVVSESVAMRNVVCQRAESLVSFSISVVFNWSYNERWCLRAKIWLKLFFKLNCFTDVFKLSTLVKGISMLLSRRLLHGLLLFGTPYTHSRPQPSYINRVEEGRERKKKYERKCTIIDFHRQQYGIDYNAAMLKSVHTWMLLAHCLIWTNNQVVISSLLLSAKLRWCECELSWREFAKLRWTQK